MTHIFTPPAIVIALLLAAFVWDRVLYFRSIRSQHAGSSYMLHDFPRDKNGRRCGHC